MSDAQSEHDAPRVREFEDPKTGQRYLMYPLNIAAWPCPPRLVYHCQGCQGRFEASDWGRGCPVCSGRRKPKRRRKHD